MLVRKAWLLLCWFFFQLYNRRSNGIKGVKELKYWKAITYSYMSLESSDSEQENTYIVHSPAWRSKGTCIYYNNFYYGNFYNYSSE